MTMNPFDNARNDYDSRAQIGRDGLLSFLDEMNEKRARAGIRQRYRPVENEKDELTAEFWYIPRDESPHSRGPIYCGPRLASV